MIAAEAVRESPQAASLNEILNTHLRQVLRDLKQLVPFDVGAAWLGHDDRPSLRVVLPVDARLPDSTAAHHLVFQNTAEPALISDLRRVGDGAGEYGGWLGLPLFLNGQRRGWIELYSTQPHRFGEAHLQTAEVVVRHAADALAQREVAFHTELRLMAQDRLLTALERMLLAPSLAAGLQALVAELAMACAASSAALLLPTELAFSMGLQSVSRSTSSHDGDESLVVEVARWPLGDTRPTDDAPFRSETVLPLQRGEDTLGWLSLTHPAAAMVAADPADLRRVLQATTALVTWLSEQAQREQQSQQSLRVLVQHAQQLRVGSLSDVMAGLAHELNNPLSAILGIATLLLRNHDLPPAARADVEAIAQETQRVSQLVDRLSNFGQSSISSKCPVDLAEIVNDTLGITKGIAEQRGVAISAALPETPMLVMANRAQLHQVCLDLLGNALEAIDTCDEPRIVVSVEAEGAWAVLRVNDNGYGIPDDLRERVFTPGFTTKIAGGTRRGLGIGLPMALDIVNQHGGTLTVTSKVWQGSTFVVRLPLI